MDKKLYIQSLHREAMAIADCADEARNEGKTTEGKLLYQDAYSKEKGAAMIAIQEEIGEPSTSILIRSAASLAYDAGKYRECEQMVGLGLSRETPEEIAEELRDLLENVHFSRHLQLKGVTLAENEMQFVVAGKGVAFGMAREEDVNKRVNAIKNIALRTIERKKGLPFRTKGRPAEDVVQLCQPYMSIPRAASFAITLRFGVVSMPTFEGMPTASNALINDIAENIALVNSGDIEQLKNRIQDDAYLTNFMGYTKELAPDGDDVNLVGITYSSDGNIREVQFTQTKNELSQTIGKYREIKSISTQTENHEQILQIEGFLSAADSKNNFIKITNKEDKIFKVIVPEGLTDIVRGYFDEIVQAVVKSTSKGFELINID